MGSDSPLLEQQRATVKRIRKYRDWIVSGIIIVVVVVIVMSLILDDDEAVAHPSSIKDIDKLPPGSYKVTGTDVYVTGTADPVIVLLPDINGMSVQVKKIADFFAQGGFTAIVIDYFNGDPRNASDPDWNNRHPANLSLALAHGVISDLHRRGYLSIQAQGYCYGGRIGVSLSFNNTIRSGAVAHPSSLVAGDALLISKPFFFEMPSTDTFNSLAPYFNQTLQERKIPSQFKTYPNTTHGFAVSDTINPTQKAIAMEDSLKWFHVWV